jgi:DNA-binding LacI/PurR family transcriptional regulator
MKTTQSKPRYVRLADEYRRDIRSGVLAPGSRLPTFQEMRQQHGVSQSILERVHALLQEEGLIERRERSGIYVSAPRTSEVKRPSGAIALAGLQSWYAGTPYFVELMAGVQDVLAPAGVNFVVVNNDAAEPAAWERIDGLLVCESKPALFRQMVRRRPPGMACVALLVPAEDFDDVTNVAIDDAAAMRTLTEYLLSLGHRRIAYLSARGDLITRRRVQGYRATLEAAGIAFSPAWARRIYVPRPAERAAMSIYARAQYTMRAWLQSDWGEQRCTALLAQNDEVAAAAIDVFHEFGLRVPDDVSVAGFDGLETPARHPLQLTTIEVPLRRIGRRGAQLLLDAINEKASDDRAALFPASLRIGNSTAPPAGASRKS